MAANLKPPSYFSRPVTVNNDGPELIPPSLFQKSKQKVQQSDVQRLNLPPSREMKDAAVSVHPIKMEDVNGQATVLDPESSTMIPKISHSHIKELSDATKAIMELNKENLKLLKRSRAEDDGKIHNLQKEREQSSEHRSPVYLSPTPVDYHTAHMFPIQHTSEIIARQASEIGQLKAEIQNVTTRYQQQISELRGCVQDHERENVTAVIQLEARLKQSTDTHASEVKHLKALSQQKQNQIEDLIKAQAIEIEKSKAASEELHHHNLQLEKQLESTKLQYENRIRECGEEKSKLEEQLKKLQTYMSNAVPSSKSTAMWQVEKQQYNQQIKNLEKDCSGLKTSLELTNLRLTSALEIQSIQDIELSKELTDNCTKEENILTKWRKNVFKLMVQRKSLDLTMKNIEQNHKNLVDNLEEKLETVRNEVEILNHKLNATQAQLQIQLNRNKDLEEQVVSSNEVAVILDKKLEVSEQACMHIKETLNRYVSSVNTTEELMQNVLKNLSQYNNRISYAFNRIEILKGLFQRKEAMWKLKVDGMSANRETTELATNCELALKEELKQTIEERDLLALRLKEDSQVALQQIQANESESKGKTERIEELEDLVLKKNKNSSDLEEQLKEALKQIADLQEELTKKQYQYKKVSDELQHSLKYENQLAAMESHLNTARREHTKAVVSMRQCERKAVREKQRLEDLIKSQETFYKAEIEKQQKQLITMQKDNNILKATLRQEGLISRGLTADIGQDDVMETSHKHPQFDTGKQANDASLSNIVDDVKNLTSHMFTSD